LSPFTHDIKIRDGQDLTSAGDQVPKQMWPCFCRGST